MACMILFCISISDATVTCILLAKWNRRIQVQIILKTFNIITFPLKLLNSAFQPTLYLAHLKVVFNE